MKINVKSIKAAGNIWEKNGKARVYFNNKSQIAKLFNYSVVEKKSGMVPAGFDGMIKEAKTKSYFDINSEIFYTDCGDIANACRDNDVSVRRI